MEWYCVHAKAKRESSVANFLEDTYDLETFCPLFEKVKVIRRVKRKVTLPLFPGYLFCRFEFAKYYRAVRYAHHALGLVSCGGKPVIVHDEIVAQLKDQIGDLMVSAAMDDQLREGDQVKVLGGPMQGMGGTVLKELGDSDRVAVLMTLLNGDVRVVISRSQVVLDCV